MSDGVSSDDGGLSTIIAAVDERTSRGIAAAVDGLVRDGILTSGQRLATVRRVAAALEVSPATVSVAWTHLTEAGRLHTDRRRGTVVMAATEQELRAWSGHGLDEHLPDPMLLPTLDNAFAFAAACRRPDQDADAMEVSLREAVPATWPYPAPAITIANGGYEGTLLALRATVRPGGSVAVEQPTSPRIMQTLRALRAVIIPVAGDSAGPLPDALQQALFRRPDVFLFQPRSQVPTGSSLTHRRIGELAAVLAAAPAPVIVIEDDNIGPASSLPARSLAVARPEGHVLIRSYCKAFGIDIRTCVISGPPEVVARIERIRSLGMLATSRMLQSALAALLCDVDTERRLRIARRRHRDRRLALAEALGERGVNVTADGDGLALWVPVSSEERAHRVLARHAITVGSGAACGLGEADAPHIWIGTGQLPDAPARIAELADLVASAAMERGGALATVS
jgi:DNA-binding transcriptional MocR family regulator